MNTADKFGNKVRALRKQQGLTQEQIAAKMDRSVDSISQIERGVNLPSFETLDRLSIALNISVRDFFDDIDQSRERSELIAVANGIFRTLGDRDLRIAIEQLKVFGIDPS